MSWTYSGNPKKRNLDAVRYQLQLTDEDNKQLEDEEIEFELSQENDNVNRAAANIAESLAAKFAQKAKRSVGPTKIDYSDISERYLKIAKRLRSEETKDASHEAVAISEDSKENQEDDSDLVDPLFTRRMHENN